MCCFTRPITSVTATRIFARVDQGDRQFLVYSMQVAAPENLAMVLPLPVKPGTGEGGVTFINLKEYPDFFDDMEKGFPQPPVRHMHEDGPMISASLEARPPPLMVLDVGDFEASFVPTEEDFSRLDERFRLPEGAWKKLPAYQTYGFAVFKLKPGLQRLHPMAFSFPRRDKATLFFPTVHIHDGKVHDTAHFDHVLYCQPREGEPLKFHHAHGWAESPRLAGTFMHVAKAKGLIDAERHCYKMGMSGDLPNKDTFVKLDM
jgi:hypothetical protein